MKTRKRGCSYLSLNELFSSVKIKDKESLAAGTLMIYQPAAITPAQAEKFSEEIGPKLTILLDSHPSSIFPHINSIHTFFAFGCAGDEGEAQEAVAMLANDVISSPKFRFNVKYGINAGDNFYSSGVNSPTHPDFYNKFYKIYSNPALPLLKNLPFLMSLGNHDANLHKAAQYKKKIRSFLPGLNAFKKITTIDTSISPSGREAEKNEVIHAHMLHPEDPPTPYSKYTLSQQDTIEIKHLPKFAMEYYYRTYRDGKLQYFFMDSNSLLRDYLQYLAHFAGVKTLTPDALHKNQVNFLHQEYKKCIEAQCTPILVTHNPFIQMGNRHDASQYLEPAEIRQLDKILQIASPASKESLLKIARILKNEFEADDIPYATVDAENYSLLLMRFYASHGFIFSLIICAHDHMLAYIKTEGIKGVSRHTLSESKGMIPLRRPDDVSHYPVCQIITGGGGGKLQNRYSFSAGDTVGACVEDNGLFFVSFDPTHPSVLTLDLITIKHPRRANVRQWENHLHLRFKTSSIQPVQVLPDDAIQFKAFRECITAACLTYQVFLNDRMQDSHGEFLNVIMHTNFKGWNRTHKMSHVSTMHKMLNYLNQYKAPTFNEAVQEIHDLASSLENKDSPNSLFGRINQELKKNAVLGNNELAELLQSVTVCRNSPKVN